VPDQDPHALKLKNYIFKRFEKSGLRTEGLTFGIMRGKDSVPDTSIIIREKTLGGLPSSIHLFRTYSVSYRKNFDPNSNEIIPFADGLKRRNLTNILTYLSGNYYKSLGEGLSKTVQTFREPEKKEEEKEVYQCKNCLTVYDPAAGDELQNILPGTSFEKLPAAYHCPLCDSGKEEFGKVKLRKVG
jgi:rubredoxin